MAGPKPGNSGRGPLGSHTNKPKIDKGTSARQRNKAPVDRKAGSTPSADTIEEKHLEYLLLARTASYGMQARSAKQSAVAAGDGIARWLREKTGTAPSKDKPARVQSFLGGNFLRMYLDGATDPEVIEEAGVEIGASKEFGTLTSRLQAHLQTIVTTQHLHEMAPDRVLVAADRYLDARKNSKDGIAFRNTLNTVIGGVSGVDVERVEVVEDQAAATGADRNYRIGIIFYDTYDFENKRSGEYDRYRKNLAALLIANKFDEFEEAFYAEADPFSETRKTTLDDAAVFASFMYALEKKKWTPGPLPWQVTVPTDLKLHFVKAPAKKR